MFNISKADARKLEKQIMKSPEVTKILLAQAEKMVAELPEPERYTIEIVDGEKGVKQVNITDYNADAAFYESQTGALSSLNKQV
jgi:hypothetical protein